MKRLDFDEIKMKETADFLTHWSDFISFLSPFKIYYDDHKIN